MRRIRHSYGYDTLREHDARGEPIRGGRRINGAEAEFVRRVFREFTAAKSSRAIARDLNVERIAGARGHRRSDTIIRGHTLRGTDILRNEFYLGRLVCNRQALRQGPADRAAAGPSQSGLGLAGHRDPGAAHRRTTRSGSRRQAPLGSIRELPRIAKARTAKF